MRVIRVILALVFALLSLNAWAQVALVLVAGKDDPTLLTVWQAAVGATALAAAWGTWRIARWAPAAAAAYGLVTAAMIVALGPMLHLDSAARNGLWAGGAVILAFGLGSAWFLSRARGVTPQPPAP